MINNQKDSKLLAIDLDPPEDNKEVEEVVPEEVLPEEKEDKDMKVPKVKEEEPEVEKAEASEAKEDQEVKAEAEEVPEVPEVEVKMSIDQELKDILKEEILKKLLKNKSKKELISEEKNVISQVKEEKCIILMTENQEPEEEREMKQKEDMAKETGVTKMMKSRDRLKKYLPKHLKLKKVKK